MEVILPDFRYCRLTSNNFSEEDLTRLSSSMDYAFFASPNKIPTINGMKVSKKQSAWLKICEDEDKQFSIYHATCRKHVRRSFRKPEFSVEINNTPIDELYQFHSMCEHERNWYPVPKDELASSVVICVRYLDELIAGMTAYYYQDFLRLGRIFTRRKSSKYQDLRQVVLSIASRRVVHEYTIWGKENGFSYIDLGGVSFDDDNKIGISEYKMQFGSEIVNMNLGRVEGHKFGELQEYIKQNGWDLT